MEKKDNNWIKQIPNALTVLRLIMTGVFLGLILYAPSTGKEKPASVLVTAFVIFVLAGITDAIDGHIARMLNATSKFGRIVDPLADKVLVCGTFICFAIVNQPKLANFELSPDIMFLVQWGTAIILTARELGVTILRQIAESRGIAFGAIVSGKIKMFIQSFGIGTIMIGWAFVSRPWGDWFTLITYALMVMITLYSGIESFMRPIRPEKNNLNS
jgi:CDP-diacylglycerol--glycerol-3-phosphate 3-phosphatidyltransferase